MGSANTPALLAEISKFMPKVELHAHLSGSVSDEMLMKLKLMSQIENGVNEKPVDVHSLVDDGKTSASTGTPVRSLDECWKKFGEIHEVIKSVETLYWVTCQIIGEFSQDRVIYLELRTSPKKVHGIPSKDAYLKTVIEAIIKSQKDYPIIVKLLVSLDRKMDEKDQEENVELAIKLAKEFPSVVVGMDLSGHPKKGCLSWILPLLKKARRHGLRLSCHLSESGNLEEIGQILQFNPERVAHALYVHPSLGGNDHLWQLLKSKRIPVEVCITSNVMTGITPSVEDHYVRFLHQEALPYIIGTDDSGIFQTTLSTEYQKLLQVVPLSLNELRDVTLKSIEHTFASDSEKEQVRCEMWKWWEENGTAMKKIEVNEIVAV